MNASDQNTKPTNYDANGQPTRVQGNPTLKKWQLTVLLLALAIVPSGATIGLWMILPEVQAGKLPVEFKIAGVPDPAYYQTAAEKRPPLDDPRIIITNRSSQDWDNLNVVINRGHEIRDPAVTLAPNKSVVYRLNMFYNRSGVTFQPELSPVYSLRIFARVGKDTRQSIDLSIEPEQLNQTIQMVDGKPEIISKVTEIDEAD